VIGYGPRGLFGRVREGTCTLVGSIARQIDVSASGISSQWKTARRMSGGYKRMVHCLFSESARPKPGKRRRATLIIFVMKQCR